MEKNRGNRMTRPAIDITDLSKTYRQRKVGKVHALKNLTLCLDPGEVLGFLGPNGAGKSTTIKVLTGQVRASGGCASIFGIPVDQVTARSRIGYLPENPNFYDFLSAREYLQLVGRCYSMSATDINTAADRELNRLGLEQAAKRPIKTYSKGMVQRLGIAQTLLHDPDLLLWDEPMSGLDPLGRALVRDILLDLKAAGKTIFFSSHVTADVEQVCDRVAVLVHGELQALDPIADVVNSHPSSRYLVMLRDHAGQLREVQLDHRQMQTEIAAAQRRGEVIELVRPTHDALEEYFLSLVEKATVPK